jgi:hypothetical protein
VAGRDYTKLGITVMGSVSGERQQMHDELRRFEDAGVGRYVVTTGVIAPPDYKQRLLRSLIPVGLQKLQNGAPLTHGNRRKAK